MIFLRILLSIALFVSLLILTDRSSAADKPEVSPKKNKNDVPFFSDNPDIEGAKLPDFMKSPIEKEYGARPVGSRYPKDNLKGQPADESKAADSDSSSKLPEDKQDLYLKNGINFSTDSFGKAILNTIIANRSNKEAGNITVWVKVLNGSSNVVEEVTLSPSGTIKPGGEISISQPLKVLRSEAVNSSFDIAWNTYVTKEVTKTVAQTEITPTKKDKSGSNAGSKKSAPQYYDKTATVPSGISGKDEIVSVPSGVTGKDEQ